jgi:hypothetical protein
VRKVGILIENVGGKIGFRGGEVRKLVEELDDGEFDKVIDQISDSRKKERLTDSRDLAKICGLGRFVFSSAGIAKYSKVGLLMRSVTSYAISTKCDLSGLKNADKFTIERIQHAYSKHGEQFSRFRGRGGNPEVWKEFAQFADDVISNNTKTIIKTESKPPNLKFKRFFKEVDGEPIGVDVFLEGGNVGKIRTVVKLKPSQIDEILTNLN